MENDREKDKDKGKERGGGNPRHHHHPRSPRNERGRDPRDRDRNRDRERDRDQDKDRDQERDRPDVRKGPVRTQTCFIEIDILDRIKREAKYKKVHFQILLNQILREAVFGGGPQKVKKEESPLKDCPHCGHSLKEGGPKQKLPVSTSPSPSTSAGPLAGNSHGRSSLWGKLKGLLRAGKKRKKRP